MELPDNTIELVGGPFDGGGSYLRDKTIWINAEGEGWAVVLLGRPYYRLQYDRVKGKLVYSFQDYEPKAVTA